MLSEETAEARSFLERRAGELGFSATGFARADALEVDGERFDDWLEQGHAAGMHWLEREREKRLDPGTAFGIRTVMVLSVPYAAEQPPPQASEGRVARYARGRDYHNLMGKRLRRLARELRTRYPEVVARPYVDTGPILEKVWAQRAGVGWQGKNTLILRQDRGSYHFLGVLLTSLDLSPSVPATDLCGSCRLCIDACPSSAFPSEYVLDSRRCLSYLTIEERGSVPEAFRELVADHLFGCDVCQEVCPFNTRLEQQVPADFRYGAEHESLSELLSMSDTAFAEVYRGRALKRAGRVGLARTAAVVAGNSGRSEHVQALVKALAGHDAALVRGHAAWALGRLGGDEAEQALRAASAVETDEQVLAEITEARRCLADRL